MAAEIKKSTGVDATLTPGSGGVFDVMVDEEDDLLQEVGRPFPRWLRSSGC